MSAAFFLSHFWHYFYAPVSGPWYAGQVWGNVFVIAVLAPLGWVWARTKFWPLRPIHHALGSLHERVEALHERHDQHAQSLSELHEKLDQLTKEKP